ncbi:MAG: proprotein convertase P-domain-containing protein [Gammaproteobacteria bacterium]|nr:proprotein convertase P-domain-containing protein [Gammaproteobacteria bacterium]
MKKISALVLLLWFSSCSNDPEQGIFVDAPVEGLAYHSASHAGRTGANGEFAYEPQENIRFSLANLTLGESQAKAELSPYDLVSRPDGSIDLDKLANIARLLQTLDKDENAENGIQLPSIEPSKRTIDLAQGRRQFEQDPEVLTLLASAGRNQGLISAGQALVHLQQHTKRELAGETFTIGGVITGLSGDVVLANHGVEHLNLSQNGNFEFTLPLLDGEDYKVTVATQPQNGECSVQNGEGLVVGANVNYIIVFCDGGDNTALARINQLQGVLEITTVSGYRIVVNRSGDIPIALPVNERNSTRFTIDRQPEGQWCTLASNSNSDFLFEVQCVAYLYHVGGTASGISGAVSLRLNKQETIVVNQDGGFVFEKTFSPNAEFSLEILTTPVGVSCELSQVSGKLHEASVDNIALSCAPNAHKITVKANGLVNGGQYQPLNIRNNGRVPDTDMGNGTYVFDVAYGQSYDLSIVNDPVGLKCTLPLQSNGIVSGDINGLQVQCSSDVFTVEVTVNGLSNHNNGLIQQWVSGASLEKVFRLRNRFGRYGIADDQYDDYSFTFNYLNDESFQLSIEEQPVGQTCSFNNASSPLVLDGNIQGASVQAEITCTSNEYKLNLQAPAYQYSSGNGPLSVSVNGQSLVFNADSSVHQVTLVHDQTYSITVDSQTPNGQVCSFSGLYTVSGKILDADIGVNIACENKAFSINGALLNYVPTAGVSDDLQLNISGLTRGDSSNAQITTDHGVGEFTGQVTHGQTYRVTINSPAGQTCLFDTGATTSVGYDVLIDAANGNTADIVCTNNSVQLTVSLTGFSNTRSNESFIYSLRSRVLDETLSPGYDTPIDISAIINRAVVNHMRSHTIHYNQSYVVTQEVKPKGQTCVAQGSTSGLVGAENIAINYVCTNDARTVAITISDFLNRQDNGSFAINYELDGSPAQSQNVETNGVQSIDAYYDTNFDLLLSTLNGQSCEFVSPASGITLSNSNRQASGIVGVENVTAFTVACTNKMFSIAVDDSALPVGSSFSIVDDNSQLVAIQTGAGGNRYFTGEYTKSYQASLSNIPSYKECGVNDVATSSASHEVVTSISLPVFEVKCVDKLYELSVTTDASISPEQTIDVTLGGETISVIGSSTRVFANKFAFGTGIDISLDAPPGGGMCLAYRTDNDELLSGNNTMPAGDLLLEIRCRISHTVTLDVSGVEFGKSLGVEVWHVDNVSEVADAQWLLDNDESEPGLGFPTRSFHVSGLVDRGVYSVVLGNIPAEQRCKITSPADYASFSLDRDVNISVECLPAFTISGILYEPAISYGVTISDSLHPESTFTVSESDAISASRRRPYRLSAQYIEGDSFSLALSNANCRFVNSTNSSGTITKTINDFDIICLTDIVVSEAKIAANNSGLSACITAADTDSTLSVSSIDCPYLYTLQGLEYFDSVSLFSNANTPVIDLTPVSHLRLLNTSDTYYGTPIEYLGLISRSALVTTNFSDLTSTIVDANLKQCIEQNILDRQYRGNNEIVELVCDAERTGIIRSLSGVGVLRKLKRLELIGHDIADLSPLVDLTLLPNKFEQHFEEIVITSNISSLDITPLGQISSLTSISIANASVVDVSPVLLLKDLTFLDLSNNSIEEIRNPSQRESALFYPPLAEYVDLRGQNSTRNLSQIFASVASRAQLANSGDYLHDPFNPSMSAYDNGKTSYSVNELNKPIPDNTREGVVSAIRMQGETTNNGAKITVNFTHPSLNNIDIYVGAPASASVRIVNKGVAQADTVVSGGPTYQVTYTMPTVSQWNGAWYVKVLDRTNSETGTFDSWSIEEIIP